jgi:class 3 adenylate cyclase/tetratricopeptide (TPR) repeat protein
VGDSTGPEPGPCHPNRTNGRPPAATPYTRPVTICTQCGRENPAGARFCNSCGAPLDAEPAQAREVRKTVTVLFCDVVGSTELGERLDPEVVRGVMSRFYAAIREPVERHGGTVEKVIGDALVAIFGVPVVHEDDALRAVRAALEMQAAVLAVGDVRARIGVNTGDVLAGDATAGESLVVGDAVNVAARLEQAAAPGEVLVGEATWALVGHAARGERVAPIVAKGKREPLVAWRLGGVDPAAGGHRRRLDLPMVGRESELDLLRWALARTGRIHRPHLVTILGQPGIGKSRLTSELPGLRAGLPVLVGQCRSVPGSSSLEPLLEIARGAVANGRGLPETVAALMPGEPDAEAVVACLSADRAAAAPDVAWAVSRLIGTMALAGTVVMVLEDVHAADDQLLDVVEQLVGRGRRSGLLVVCTARPEFAERRPGWGAGANTIAVALERLDDAQTRDLVAHASPMLSDDGARRVIAAAEGNPLFAEHLAALVGESDAPAGLPRSIQVLLTARLEALPEPELDVVRVASVAGREFSVAAVETLLARPIEGDLDRLEQRELVEPTAAGRCQFGHALLQEAAYGLIPKGRRGELHVQLARWLDANGASDAAVGDHLERAFVLRSELGQGDDTTARLGEEAGERLAAAGRRADAMGDPQRARRLLERALELLPANGPQQAAAMVELAAAAWNLAPRAEVERLLTAGAGLAAEHGLRALELRADLLRLGAIPDDSPDALTEHEMLARTTAALAELELLDDTRALASALCTRANVECTLGRAREAFASADRALQVLRAADEDTVWALENLVESLLLSPIPVPAAEELLGRLVDELGARPTVRAELMMGQAELALLGGRPDETWALLDALHEIERDLGRDLDRYFFQRRGEMLVRAGRFEEARNMLATAVTEIDERGEPSEDARSWLGLAEVRLGDVESSAAHTATPPPNGYESGTLAHLLLSEVRLAESDVERAVTHAREAVDIAATGDWVVLAGEARLTLARALSAAGDREAAAEQARAAVGLYTVKGYVPGIAEAEAFLESIT